MNESSTSRDYRFVNEKAFNSSPCAEVKNNNPFDIDTFCRLASRFDIKVFLGSKPLAYHLERHAGKNSFNTKIRVPLQKIQNYLESNVDDDFKRIHVTQLLGGIANCTPGFEIRAAKVAASLSRPVNLDQCLQKVRDKIGEYAVAGAVGRAVYSLDVHLYNSLLNLGVAFFNLTPLSANDPYSKNIQDNLYHSFISHFANLYTPLTILNKLKDFLFEEAQTFYKYVGEKNDEEGYDHKVYIGIIEYFCQLLGNSNDYSLPYKEALIRQGEVIIDINWPAVMQRFALKFFNEGYFNLYAAELYPQALETMVCFYSDGFKKIIPFLNNKSPQERAKFFDVKNELNENPLLMVLKYQPHALLQFIEFTREVLQENAQQILHDWLTNKNSGHDVLLTIALKSRCPSKILEGLIEEYYKLANSGISDRGPKTFNYLTLVDNEGNNLLNLALHFKNKKHVHALLETVMRLDERIVRNWFIEKNKQNLSILKLFNQNKLPYKKILFNTLAKLDLKGGFKSAFEAEIRVLITRYPFLKDYLDAVSERPLPTKENEVSLQPYYQEFCEDLFNCPGDEVMWFIEKFSQQFNFFQQKFYNVPIVFSLLTEEPKYYGRILQLLTQLDNETKFEILNLKVTGDVPLIAWLQSIENWLANSSTFHISTDILSILETMLADLETKSAHLKARLAQQVKHLLLEESTNPNQTLISYIVSSRPLLLERLVALSSKVNTDIKMILPDYEDIVQRIGVPAISMSIFTDLMRAPYARNNNFLTEYAEKYPDNFEIFFVALFNHNGDESLITQALNQPCQITGRTALHELFLINPKILSKVIKLIGKENIHNQEIFYKCLFQEDSEGNNLFRKVWQDFFQVRNYKTFNLDYDNDPESGLLLLTSSQRLLFKNEFQSLDPEEQIPEVWKMRRDSKQSRKTFLKIIEPLFNNEKGVAGLKRSNVFSLFSNVLRSNYVFSIKDFVEDNVHVLKIFTDRERVELQKIANSNNHLKVRFYYPVNFQDLFIKAGESLESAKKCNL